MKTKNEKLAGFLGEMSKVLGDAKSEELFYILKKQAESSARWQIEIAGLEKQIVENQRITKESLVKLIEVAKSLKVVLPKGFDVKVTNQRDFPEAIEVSNIDEIQFPHDIHIKKPVWFVELFEAVSKWITEPIRKTITKQLQNVNITGPRDASMAIAVRLSDGKNFYNAIMQAVAAMASSEDIWRRDTLAGLGYVMTTNNITIPNANENTLCLIKNPNMSGKIARLHRIIIGSDENQPNKMALYRIYRDPTVTANGTALAINNLKKGGIASAMAAFRIPVVSANGTLLATGNAGAVIVSNDPMDLGNLIVQNENILITVDPTAGGFDFFVTAYWEEV